MMRHSKQASDKTSKSFHSSCHTVLQSAAYWSIPYRWIVARINRAELRLLRKQLLILSLTEAALAGMLDKIGE
jgi:hypothetical protein